MSTKGTHSEDREIELAYGDFRLKVSPFGASLRGFYQIQQDGSERSIVTSYSGHRNKVGGQGDVLIPFPGRVKAGRYSFQGIAYQLEINDKEGPNAIHGFLRSVPWDILDKSNSHIVCAVDLDSQSHAGYPFSIHAEVAYSLGDAGLKCAYQILNTGDTDAPVAAGFHPYFSVGNGPIDTWTLQLPFTGMLEFENLIPTGRVLPVEGTEYDFRLPRVIGATQFNTCFVDPQRDEDDRASVCLIGADRRKLIIWTNSSLNYFVVYSGDPLPEPYRRNSLAIEPMTCASDGFNHPEWGLVSLAPGDSTAGEWGAISGSSV